MKVNDAIRKQLGTWTDVFANFIESEAWDNIFAYLKSCSGAGKVIIPKAPDLFKSFELCDKNKVRAIILLQCPYATEREMKGKKVMISSGVPMSCENIYPYQQPSLFQWHQGIEKTYGFDPLTDQRCDISYLLKEEHVLLVNSSLTVEKDKVDSHSQLWEPFTRYLLENIISQYMCGLPIVLCGTQAQRFEKYINPMCHHVLKVEHPAAASYANRDWRYSDMFEWCNHILVANNGPQVAIRWTRKKGEGDEKLPEWVTEKAPYRTDDKLPKAQDIGLPWKD